MSKKIGGIVFLLIINYIYLLPMWEKYVGNTLGIILNTLFLIVLLLLITFYWFNIDIDKVVSFINKKSNKISIETTNDVDLAELSNFKEALQDFKDFVDQPGTTVNIAKLSGLWKDDANPKEIKNLILSSEESLIIDINMIKKGWRLIGDETQIDGYVIENKLLRMFYNEFYKKLDLLEIELDFFLKDFLYYLINLLDKYGNQPSVVDLKVMPRDPDSLKRNIRIDNTDLYSLLYSEVNLVQHSVGAANLLLEEKLVQSDKIFEFIVNSSGTDNDVKKIEMPKLDELDFVFTVFAILAHDIGKASSLNFSGSPHPVASAESINLYLEDIEIDEKYIDYITHLLYAIENHHDSVIIKKNFKEVANKTPDANIILFYLYYADIKERYLEREHIINNMKNNQGLLEFVVNVGNDNNNNNKNKNNNAGSKTDVKNNEEDNKDSKDKDDSFVLPPPEQLAELMNTFNEENLKYDKQNENEEEQKKETEQLFNNNNESSNVKQTTAETEQKTDNDGGSKPQSTEQVNDGNNNEKQDSDSNEEKQQEQAQTPKQEIQPKKFTLFNTKKQGG